MSSVYWKPAPGDTDASWLAQISNLTPHPCVIGRDFNAPHRAWSYAHDSARGSSTLQASSFIAQFARQAHPLHSTCGSISHHAGPYLALSETYRYVECPRRRQGQRPFLYLNTTHGTEPRKGPLTCSHYSVGCIQSCTLRSLPRTAVV